MMALHRDLGILPGGRHGHGRSAARGRVFNDEDRTAHERSSYCAVDRPPISEIEYSGSWLPRTHVGLGLHVHTATAANEPVLGRTVNEPRPELTTFEQIERGGGRPTPNNDRPSPTPGGMGEGARTHYGANSTAGANGI